MHGRAFTWSNERRSPTMCKLDRALVSIDWELLYPEALLQALSSSVSDHAPLHLSMSATNRPKQRFKFELFWLRLEGFEEAVKEGWQAWHGEGCCAPNAGVLGAEASSEKAAGSCGCGDDCCR